MRNESILQTRKKNLIFQIGSELSKYGPKLGKIKANIIIYLKWRFPKPKNRIWLTISLLLL